MSRVSRRRLRRWRRGRWREVGGQQGRGHQPDEADRGQGGPAPAHRRVPVWRSGQRPGWSRRSRCPGRSRVWTRCATGPRSRPAADLLESANKSAASLALPSCRLGWPRSRRRSKPRPGRSTHHSRRSTAPKVHWPSAARCQCGWTTTTPHASRAPGIRGGSGRAGPASRLCPGAGSRVGEYVRTEGAVFAVQACQQSPRGRNRPTSPRRRLYGPGSEWHGRGGRPRLRPDGDGTSRGNG